ncbi:hypothetical protein BASA50_007878 [Batrachochytrium salamandrivorans]|uniref:Uncharacterized protein n=1 Tax=Batrachochytrium salamandrivorans TaxID=1357716 RepID=A0ABQ8F5Z5_9FUNG|nr:hypothetical protein BASA62_004024 [Batrachochytrium salamandrivorans]KAH6578750.1 hypothetical protein BASA60_003523 [Batrachochytrium salamandrivorans]KAH6582190.1 hypothetical protein BASA61_008650 [Batrachochytrium salamandrivorans]KAH6592827.1 hypothetical protein BASA50_007878 [Batrachochytrium salamandrivorans]
MPSEHILDKLRDALALVETVKAESECYKNNFEQLKENYATLQGAHEEVERKCSVIEKEKDISEKGSAKALHFWKQLLSEQGSELDQLKKQVHSQKSVEELRLELLAELDKSQKMKWELLNKDSEKYRELYYKTKRDVEALFLEKEQMKIHFDRDVKDIQSSKIQEIKIWEMRFLTIQQSIDIESDTERLRVVQREKLEIELKTTLLLSELDEVRAEKEKNKLDYEQSCRSHTRQLAEHLGEANALKTEKDSLQAKVVSLEQEVSMSLRRQDELGSECISLKKELEKANSRLEESAHQFNLDVSDMKMAALKGRTEHESHVCELKDKILELKSSIKLLNTNMRDMSQKLCNNEKEYLERCRLIREEEWTKISLLEGEKAEIERNLSSCRQRVLELENRDEVYRQQTSTEHDRLKLEIQELLCSQDALELSNRGLLTEKGNFQSELNHLQARCLELSTLASTSDSKLDEYKKKVSLQNEAISSLESSIQSHSHDFQALQDQSEKEREAFLHSLERQKSSLVHERLQSAKRIDALTKDNLKAQEKVKELDHNLVEQNAHFDNKVTSLKEKIRVYKSRIHELKLIAPKLIDSVYIKKWFLQNLLDTENNDNHLGASTARRN